MAANSKNVPKNTSQDAKIRIVFEETEDAGRNIPLSELLRAAEACNALLKEAAKDALGGKKCEFLVHELSYSSPVCMEISVKSDVENPGQQVVAALSEQERRIREEKNLNDLLPPKHLSIAALKKWRKAAKYNDKKIGAIRIESAAGPRQKQVSCKMDTGFRGAIESFEYERVYRTDVAGRMDSIDLHNRNTGIGKFTLYTSVPQWGPVDVFFDYKKFKDEVVGAFQRIVRVRGMARNRKGRARPVSIKMEKMQVLTEGGRSLADLEGIAPDILGGKTLQEFLDEMKEGWER